MKTYRLERDIPVEEDFDLVVAGGGPAGCAAAIAAGRLGLRVLLAEAVGCLGGMGTSGLVSAFNPMADGEQLLVRGIMEEIVETLYRRGFIADYITPDSWRKNLHHWTPFDPEGLKLLLDELVSDASVVVRFFTRVIDADVDSQEKRVNGVVLQNIEGYRYVPVKAAVDATGDAVLSALCGVDCREPFRDTPAPMPPTLCSLFAGIDWENVSMGGINGSINPRDEQAAVERAVADNHFSQPDTHLPGMMRLGRTHAFLNGGHVFLMNALNAESLSNGMMKGRLLAQEYKSFYRAYLPGFENCELLATASLMGIRESRRIVGEYELNHDDFLARRQFPDQIGVFANFVDIHPYECTEEEMNRIDNEVVDTANWLGKGECFGIPYGIIVPKGWRNLWTAGRCNSSDVRVHGAIRVQPAAYLMGQAAGTAAAQAVRTGQAACDLDTAELVGSLRAAGCYLPQDSLPDGITRS